MIGRDVKVTWYGHGTWGWTSPGGVRILVDPFLTDNPSTPDTLKRPDTDLILVTHGHGDHVGDVAAVAARTGAPVLAPVEVGDWLESQGVDGVVTFNQGGTVEQRGVRFTMTKAEHTGGLPGGAGGPALYGGEPKGYVITFENGFRVYQSGDTDVFSDMAVLSIGDHFTMGPYAAAHAVRLLGVRQVLGGHWGTFPPLVGTPAALRDELATLGVDAEVLDIAPGQTLE